MNDRRTWSRNHGLAIWNYCLCKGGTEENGFKCPLNPKPRAIWLASRTECILSALTHFARPRKTSISTRSGGEDAFVVKWNTDKATGKFLQRLRRTSDIIAIDISLALDCLEADAKGKKKELTIESGGILTISVDLDGKGNLDTTFDDPISLSFFLNADIYLPLTWGKIRENAELAALNGPKLSNFLKRLEREIPAKFDGVLASDYKGLVGHYGFIAPPI